MTVFRADAEQLLGACVQSAQACPWDAPEACRGGCFTDEHLYGHRKHVLAALEAVIGAVSCSAMSGSRPVASAEIGWICASIGGSSWHSSGRSGRWTLPRLVPTGLDRCWIPGIYKWHSVHTVHVVSTNLFDASWWTLYIWTTCMPPSYPGFTCMLLPLLCDQLPQWHIRCQLLVLLQF